MADPSTAGPGPGYAKNPDHYVRIEPSPRRVRAVVGGEAVADSTRMRLLHEAGHLPVYHFPLEDIRFDLMAKTDTGTHCPYKGDASYWSLTVGERTVDDILWRYERPFDEVPELAGLAAFYWGKVDHWYEEDEEIFVHARDPYKRVDAIPSSREVRVVLGGEEVARTRRAHFVFETNLPVRYYIPREDVRTELLAPTASATRCPYKGEAVYWQARIGGRVFEDIVWSYPVPIPECPRIRDLMCFYNENVDTILVDGEETEKPKTKWSR